MFHTISLSWLLAASSFPIELSAMALLLLPTTAEQNESLAETIARVQPTNNHN
jgi:hypothetical protein